MNEAKFAVCGLAISCTYMNEKSVYLNSSQGQEKNILDLHL